ncbi:MAG: DUF2065 domain-containing protein [Comamonadaceae bacterium]|nr:DUF2065 domain-containing protein [Comamonadaceae bacterium]
MELSDSFWTALALVLVIEGLLPFVSPASWRRVFTQMVQLHDSQIRFFALVCIVSGIAMLRF